MYAVGSIASETKGVWPGAKYDYNAPQKAQILHSLHPPCVHVLLFWPTDGKLKHNIKYTQHLVWRLLGP